LDLYGIILLPLLVDETLLLVHFLWPGLPGFLYLDGIILLPLLVDEALLLLIHFLEEDRGKSIITSHLAETIAGSQIK
jgi:hypothetical protein